MRVTRIEIRNFWSIRHLTLELGDTTVFIDPNNVGKTAILDAVRLAQARPWGTSGTRFGSTDIHDPPPHSDENHPSSASIALRVEESALGEWPRSLADTSDSTNPNSTDHQRSFALRVHLAPDAMTGRFHEKRRVLTAKEAVPEQDAFPADDWPWRYLPVFYLGVSRAVPARRAWQGAMMREASPTGLGLSPIEWGTDDSRGARVAVTRLTSETAMIGCATQQGLD